MTELPTALLRCEWPPSDGLRPGDERFDAVLESVRRDGIKHPLVIRADWQVVDGAHRLYAARLLGLKTVPVVIWTGAEFLPGEPSRCRENECDHEAEEVQEALALRALRAGALRAALIELRQFSEAHHGDEDKEIRLTGVSGISIDLFADLRGHDLACWCPLDQPCHADILLELANA